MSVPFQFIGVYTVYVRYGQEREGGSLIILTVPFGDRPRRVIGFYTPYHSMFISADAGISFLNNKSTWHKSLEENCISGCLSRGSPSNSERSISLLIYSMSGLLKNIIELCV